MSTTYTARSRDHLLWLRFPAKTAEERRPERIAVIYENVVVGALGAHALECQRDELAVVARLDQPLAVRVLKGGRDIVNKFWKSSTICSNHRHLLLFPF